MFVFVITIIPTTGGISLLENKVLSIERNLIEVSIGSISQGIK